MTISYPSETRKNHTPQSVTSKNSHEQEAAPATMGVAVNRGLLRVEEAAEWLGLGRTKAYELVYRGILPSVTIGRSRRISVVALQAFVERLSAEGDWP
jgi:excisionase family DNA binding protein